MFPGPAPRQVALSGAVPVSHSVLKQAGILIPAAESFMSSQVPRLRADSRSPVRYASIQRELRRFPPAMRPAVFAVARRHIRLAELSLSFPALLAALTWPRAALD